MGRVIELTKDGDASIIFEAVAGLAAAAGAVAGYIARGGLVFEVGDRHPEGVYVCTKCEENSKLADEPGQVVKAFDKQACTIVAMPRQVGG